MHIGMLLCRGDAPPPSNARMYLQTHHTVEGIIRRTTASITIAMVTILKTVVRAMAMKSCAADGGEDHGGGDGAGEDEEEKFLTSCMMTMIMLLVVLVTLASMMKVVV